MFSSRDHLQIICLGTVIWSSGSVTIEEVFNGMLAPVIQRHSETSFDHVYQFCSLASVCIAVFSLVFKS